MDIETKLARAKSKLILKYPFFGSMALGLKMEITDKVPTAATDGRRIMYNPDFVNSLTDEKLTGLIAHEAMHVVWKHHLRMQDRDCKKWNFACDFAINETLIEEGFELPEEGCFNKDYRNMNAEAIYDRLEEDYPEDENGNQPWDGEDEHVIAPTDENGNPLDESQMKEAGLDVDRMITVAAETAKAVGKMPNSLKDFLNELKEAKVDWREILRTSIQGENPEDYTFRKPNRRQLPNGIYMPSIYKQSVGKVIIGLDTSGSVSMEELNAFLSEICAIQQECDPEEIVIVNIDSDISKVDRFLKGEPIDEYEVEGRGGTNMKPFFDWVEENEADDLHLAILFSDFEFMWHDLDEPMYDVLHVSTGSREHAWGKLVKIM